MTSKYTRKITKLPDGLPAQGGAVTVELDVYDVLAAWEVTNPAIQHAVKKLLMPGARGAKSKVQDIEEALSSIKRALELEGWAGKIGTPGIYGKLPGQDEVGIVTPEMWSKLPAIDPRKLSPMPPVKTPRTGDNHRPGSIRKGWSPEQQEACLCHARTIKDITAWILDPSPSKYIKVEYVQALLYAESRLNLLAAGAPYGYYPEDEGTDNAKR